MFGVQPNAVFRSVRPFKLEAHNLKEEMRVEALHLLQQRQSLETRNPFRKTIYDTCAALLDYGTSTVCHTLFIAMKTDKAALYVPLFTSL